MIEDIIPSLYVNGSSKMTAIEELTPGRDPATRPHVEPATTRSKFSGVKT